MPRLRRRLAECTSLGHYPDPPHLHIQASFEPLQAPTVWQAHQDQGVLLSTHTPSAFEPQERARLLARLEEALSRVEELTPLDEARFLETHAIYEGRSDQRQRIIGWFAEQIAPTLRSDSPFRVLSVGCGSGMLDVPVAARLAPRTAELRYVGVNPNRVECEVFERSFQRAALSGVGAEVVPASFEAFETDGSFDLIHFVHCLYYMSDPAAALEKARKLLGSGGRLVVFQAPCEALNALSVRFWNKEYARPTFFAEDFAELLDRWGWRYERGRLEATVEVTPFLDRDPEVGRALRDFIVQIDSQRLPPAVLELVDRYLRLIAVEDGGRNRVAHPVDVFLIDG